MSSSTGAGLLLRQNLRRDRVLVPAWVAVLVLTVYASAAATQTIFALAQDRVTLATAINEQPGLLALYGPILAPGSVGELAMSKMTVLYALLSAVLYVVVVRRHTRVEEETGRAELLAGTVVGRDAPAIAVIVECGAVAAGLGVLSFLASVAGGLPVAGSFWFAVTWVGTGWVATGVAVVACQVSASARTCASVAGAILGGAFVVRAVGDAVDGLSWLSWLSPLGWNTQLRAWSDPRWGVAGLYVLLTLGLVAAGQAMRARRDLGAGLVEARPGPTSSDIAGPLSLLLRLLRTSLVLWTLGAASMGLAFGAMAPGFDDLLRDVGGGEMVDRMGGSFLAALMSISAIVVTVFSVSAVGGAHHDEVAGRTGLVVSTTVSRRRWFASTAGVALGAVAWLLLVTAAAVGLGFSAAGGTGGSRTVIAALGLVPATWVVVAAALVGLAARRGWVGWTVLVMSLVIMIVGDLLELPTWVTHLSPYAAVPSYPAVAWEWTPVLVLVAVSAGLLAAAWAIFSRRDIV